MSGEQDLWREVLWLAIQDALKGVSTTSSSCKGGRLREIRHARIYLTKPNRDFNDVCHLAGVDPQATRERLTKLIAEAPSPEELIDADSPRAKTFTAFGRTATFEEWSKNTGIAKNVLWNRIADPKWTPERAVTEPVRARSCFRRARSRSEMDA